MKAPTPKADRLREMREERHESREKKQKANAADLQKAADAVKPKARTKK